MNTRNIEIKVRLSRKEAESLNKRVRKSRLSREAYLRHLINGSIPRDAPPSDYFSMMRELYRVGNNLNQIAQKAHTLNVIDVQRYDHAQQAIFVRRGMGAADIFRSVSTELAHAGIATMKEKYTREEAAFSAYCASYMLCKKYGVDVGGYNFSTLPDSLRESDPQTQRAALSEIRDTAANISARMSRALDARSLSPREQER